MVTMAQSTANWRNTHTHMDRMHSVRKYHPTRLLAPLTLGLLLCIGLYSLLLDSIHLLIVVRSKEVKVIVGVASARSLCLGRSAIALQRLLHARQPDQHRHALNHHDEKTHWGLISKVYIC